MQCILDTYTRILLVILLFVMLGHSYGQKKVYNLDSISKFEDVKVGLVLSGGGAKGLAHIGALKVIEKAGIRIDYIGGTSMGAIVGSLYAAGYSAKQLDSVFRAVDFDKLIQDDLPRNAKTFYEREDSEKYALTLPFDNFKITLPQGFSKGQNFYNEFSRLTAPVHHIEDLDKMPIPFFCITTNIETGRKVMLDKGYLPGVVAASGALPSVFSPVEMNGMLFTDGGVTNNYPVREIREKGAEIVIGIDVQDSLLSKDQLNSVTNIMMQINNFRTINAMKKKSLQTDVYIKPSIKGFSVVSFDQIEDIISNGEKATMKSWEELQKIKAHQKKPPKPQNIKIPKLTDSITIKDIKIIGPEKYTRSYIKGKLKLQLPKKTTYADFNEGINNLSATGNFDRVIHRLIGGDEKILILKLNESKSSTLLRFALHYDDLYNTGALINLTKKKVLFNNDVASLDVVLGDNIRYNFDYYIDKGYYWSVGIKNSYNKFDKDVDYNVLKSVFNLPEIEVNQINLDFLNFKTQFYLETLLNQFSLGIGAEHRRFRLISETIGEDDEQLPRIVFDNTDYWSVFSYLKYDSFDHKYFPTKGVLFEGDLHYYSIYDNPLKEDMGFAVAQAHLGYAQPITDKLSFNLGFTAGARVEEENLRSFNFFLGGFGAKKTENNVPFYGYDFLNIVGDSFAKGAFSIDYEVFKKNHLNFSANYANVGSQLFHTGNWLDSPEYSGYAFGYGIDTIAGPLQIKYSFSPEFSSNQWFFSLGFWF